MSLHARIVTKFGPLSMGQRVRKPDFRLNKCHCLADINFPVHLLLYVFYMQVITPGDNAYLEVFFFNSLAKA